MARRVETEMPGGKLRNHKNFVGFGFLVRQRRLAQAIRRLGAAGAYEGRMLLRTMIEIQVNYAWIRAQRGHSRALRFMAFESLERLQVAQELFKTFGTDQWSRAVRRFRKERTAVRHLFRRQRKWAKHWASVPVLIDRLLEVIKREGSAQYPFLYGVYRWTSSAIHGGPVSLSENITTAQGKTTAKKQPESEPKAQLHAAAAILWATTSNLIHDTRTKRIFSKDLDGLHKAVLGWPGN